MKTSALIALAGLLAACGSAAPSHSTTPLAPAAATTAPEAPAAAPAAPTAPALAKTEAASASTPGVTARAEPEPLAGKAPELPFGELFDRLSEKGGYYFSHNYVTNETSYLQVARVLSEKATQGQAYIGVGPEQNFTYIAMTRPAMAFVVDIRRRNALLHLVYKAIFDEARTRTHFLSLLLSRPYDAASDPGDAAEIEQVMAAVERSKPDKEVRDRNRARFLELIEKRYTVKLSDKDRDEIRESLQAFFERQLEITFEVLTKNPRKRAPFREILAMRDPEGRQLGFLAREEEFRHVQRMQRENRIVPVVGDFAGDHALRAIGSYLRDQGLKVSVFYASNVEEYLFDGRVFRKWADNVAALPSDGQSLFVRAFLVRKNHTHQAQQKGHRVATFAQPMARFIERQQTDPYKSWVELSYDPKPVFAHD